MNSVRLGNSENCGELTKGKELQILFQREDISTTIVRLAEEIKKDYQGKNPVLVGVLKGCFIFMADLIRCLDMPLEVEFVALSSYGRGMEKTSGQIKVVH